MITLSVQQLLYSFSNSARSKRVFHSTSIIKMVSPLLTVLSLLFYRLTYLSILSVIIGVRSNAIPEKRFARQVSGALPF